MDFFHWLRGQGPQYIPDLLTLYTSSGQNLLNKRDKAQGDLASQAPDSTLPSSLWLTTDFIHSSSELNWTFEGLILHTFNL